MVTFYLKLTRKRIADGMSREAALQMVPEKWRDAVEAALENDT